MFVEGCGLLVEGSGIFVERSDVWGCGLVFV